MKKVKGREYLDTTPVEWPIGLSVPESLEQKIARMVRTGVSQFAQEQGAESFEEADDFDIGDEEEVSSPHELDDDQLRIMADMEAVRRIPPQFREAFEREIERRRAAAEKAVEKPSVAVPGDPAKVAPT